MGPCERRYDRSVRTRLRGDHRPVKILCTRSHAPLAIAYSPPDALAATPWRGRGWIPGLGAPVDEEGEEAGTRRRGRAREARGRHRRLPHEPEGPCGSDREAGLRVARDRAPARAEAVGRP